MSKIVLRKKMYIKRSYNVNVNKLNIQLKYKTVFNVVLTDFK